jgi:2-methylcitrate dehydratase PrpD
MTTGATAALADFAATAQPPARVRAAVRRLLADPPGGTTPRAVIGRAIAAGLATQPASQQSRHDALAVGWEVGLRVQRTLDGRVEGGWDPLVAAVLAGTAAATGRLHGTAAGVVTTALGIALTQAGGFAGVAGTPLGRFAHRLAVERGQRALQLAAAGVTAPPTGFEGRRGLVALVAPSADPADAVRDLHTIWLCAPLDPQEASP